MLIYDIIRTHKFISIYVNVYCIANYTFGNVNNRTFVPISPNTFVGGLAITNVRNKSLFVGFATNK